MRHFIAGVEARAVDFFELTELWCLGCAFSKPPQSMKDISPVNETSHSLQLMGIILPLLALPVSRFIVKAYIGASQGLVRILGNILVFLTMRVLASIYDVLSVVFVRVPRSAAAILYFKWLGTLCVQLLGFSFGPVVSSFFVRDSTEGELLQRITGVFTATLWLLSPMSLRISSQ